MKLLGVFWILLGGFYAVSATNTRKVVFCYYGTWATNRSGDGKFDVDHIDPYLCTHIAYSFVGIDEQGFMISLDPTLDLPDNGGQGNFAKFNAVKSKNPSLKTVLAVGGWNEGSAKYSVMAADPTLRANFIQSSLSFMLDYGFDGLNLDWEYPNARDSVHGDADVNNFSILIKELRTAFDEHSLTLSAAVYAIESGASRYYDVPEISKYLDFINVMTYDMYGPWDAFTGHNSPLYAGLGDQHTDSSTLFTVENAVKYWIRAGAAPEKLLLGLPFYGHTYTLADPTNNGVRAPSIGTGLAGPFTASNGFMGYNEICVELESQAWTVKYDYLAEVPYAYKGQNWISYDNPHSIATKVNYALDHNLGGVMLWSIETDDFHGKCGNAFPLLKAINDALGRDVSSTAAPTITTDGQSSASTATACICTVAGFMADPEDCSSYYICVANNRNVLVPFKFHCPATLLWDQNGLHCNYADQVQCTNDCHN